MIKIEKSEKPPQRLIKKGRKEKADNNKLYDANPTDYINGDSEFEFDNLIYGHKAVKEQLKKEQFGKCCYCEAEFTANGYGDVEHFRPKGGYQQHRNDEIKKPGYYWKAYDWDNLFFSCQICNTSYKRNYFPLADETQRAKSHHYDIDKESPLLIHPSQDTPENHIGFREGVCFPKDDKGKESIFAYGIDRDELIEQRREYLNEVDNNYIIARLPLSKMNSSIKESLFPGLNMTVGELKSKIKRARQFLNKAAKANKKFASMVRHNFPDLPK